LRPRECLRACSGSERGGEARRAGAGPGSRSLAAAIRSGGLGCQVDVLATYGIAVHRVVGERQAVQRANRRRGYV